MKKIYIYDTTLRDGTQGENISFTVEDKIKIALKLDEMGIDFVEGGWPGSNPRDKEFFNLVQKTKFKHTKIVAFGATRKANIKSKDDANLKELIASKTKIITLFGKSWDLHVKKVLRTSLKENLSMIEDSIKFLKKKNRQVFYDAEHFFDGYKNNKNYAMKTIILAAKSGAEYIVLCDTNGGCLPFEIEKIVRDCKTKFKEEKINVPIGIHTHNDTNLAVANSIVAIQVGANLVQGTINGYGERCGNADLTSIIPILEIKLNKRTVGKKNLKNLKNLSRFVSEAANMVPQKSRPFVGKSAFAHKGGIHVSAVKKETKAYEHIEPCLVGNRRRVLISDLSGKSNIEYKAKELGYDIKNSKKITKEIKKLENKGFQFDAADASFKILMDRFTDKLKTFFQLEKFRVTIEKDKNKKCYAYATIKLDINGKKEVTVAEGDGPVSALDNAMRKALCKVYKGLDSMQLIDFKVRVLDGKRRHKIKSTRSC